ncbi:MAG: hypothetical protein A07HR60_00965 [uncultured archaeon A07HR60]|nr:MAG: hypothetical protein A07HR60_00965 [uncultured archaeon A07HR60]
MRNVTARTHALDAPVFGVDVQSGDVRGDSPSYALVILEPVDENDDDPDAAAAAAGADGPIARIHKDVVSFRKLSRLIDDRDPAIIATDNVYELATDKDDLVGLLRSLPDVTRLVQVTGAERPEPLSRVASRHGIPYSKDPMNEAEASARLAAASVGQVVTAFDDTTRVKVARGRSTGSGGWSQDRYTRRIHGNVKKRSRDVESELRSANLEYDRDVTEKYGGYSNAIFTVDAAPQDLPVSSSRAGDVRVEIEREQRDGIEFEPIAKRRDRVVVGIDPGTTTAVGIASLDGEILDQYSSRTADTAEVTKWIIEQGRPVIIAADVTPMPETVEKIRRSFDAAGWTPPSDLPVDEKLHRTRDHKYDNDHERDAMAAALYAVDDHEDQFERITAKVPPVHDRGEVIARVVAGESSVEAVLADLADDPEETTESEDSEDPELSAEEQEIRRLRRQVDRLEDHVDDLQTEVDEKASQIDEYEEELSEAKRKERVEARTRRSVSRLERKAERLETERDEARDEVSSLERKVERLKAMWKLDHSDFSDVATDRDLVAVKTIEQFTTDAIEKTDREYGLVAGDVVYLRDASGAGRRTAERLAATEPRLVFRNGGISEVADQVLFASGVPVAPAEDVQIQEVDELAVARESDVEEAIERWEQQAETREREQKAEMVDQIISEHRAGERLRVDED